MVCIYVDSLSANAKMLSQGNIELLIVSEQTSWNTEMSNTM